MGVAIVLGLLSRCGRILLIENFIKVIAYLIEFILFLYMNVIYAQFWRNTLSQNIKYKLGSRFFLFEKQNIHF